MHEQRRHLTIEGDSHEALGQSRGEQLRATLRSGYERYAELFRLLGISEETERAGAQQALAAIASWRPAIERELAAIATASGMTLLEIIALNARTEIIALGGSGSHECSTLTASVDGRNMGVQTWDWHCELEAFWHTQIVDGPGYRVAGLTEHGILSKIGVNEAGLALHFNILGHRDDGVGGVPVHVLSAVVLRECSTVAEAIALIQAAPIASSSAFTLIDETQMVSVEMSPVGVRVIEAVEGSVQRTNHFQDPSLCSGQKNELYEPGSSARLALIRERIGTKTLGSETDLIAVLATKPGEPELTCRPDMSLGYGERWATLATIVTDPERHSIRVFDGKPPEAPSGEWVELKA